MKIKEIEKIWGRMCPEQDGEQASRLDQAYNLGEDQIEEDLLLAKIQSLYYQLFHHLAPTEAGDLDYRFAYDSKNMVARWVHVDASGTVTCNGEGYAVATVEWRYDRSRRPKSVLLRYYDAENVPCRNRMGNDHMLCIFDEHLQLVEMNWTDENGFGKGRDNLSRIQLEWEDEIMRVRYFDNAGQLSTYFQYVFDETGRHIRLRMGLEDNGALMTDEDGGHGSWIERDAKTHEPLALWNINLARQRIQAVDGVAYWKLTFPSPRIQRFQYFNANGVAMTNHEGAYGFECEYDEWGNLAVERNLDADCRLMENKYGIARFDFEHDELGRITTVHAWDVRGEAVANAEGVHSVRQTYTDTADCMCMVIKKYDKDGKLLDKGAHAPYITWYLSAHETLQYCVDPESLVIAPNANGKKWMVHREYDDCGRVLIETNCDENGKNCEEPSGTSGYCYEYKDNTMVSICINAASERVDDETGSCITVSKYDRWRRLVCQYRRDCEGHVLTNEYGDSGTGFEYDEEGNITFVSLDANMRPHANLRGYTYYSVEKDSFGRDVRELWFDDERKPFVSPIGDSGVMTVYRPHVKEMIRLDANGDPHDNLQGVAIVHIEYDDREREVYSVAYNLDGEPVARPEGYCALRTTYHEDMPNHRTRTFLDEKDQPVCVRMGAASLEEWMDDQGRVVKEMRYDTDMLPAVDEEGVCGNTFRYLAPVVPNGESQIVGQLDSDGKVVSDDTGIAFWQVDTDSLERPVQKRWFDAEMKPCKDDLEIYGYRWRYDDDDLDGERPKERICLSRNGRLKNNRLGVARILYIYDAQGKCRQIFFDKNGVFVDPKGGEDDY